MSIRNIPYTRYRIISLSEDITPSLWSAASMWNPSEIDRSKGAPVDIGKRGVSTNMLMCRQWWKVCWVYGDQEKFYRQLYGRKSAPSATVVSLEREVTTLQEEWVLLALQSLTRIYLCFGIHLCNMYLFEVLFNCSWTCCDNFSSTHRWSLQYCVVFL